MHDVREFVLGEQLGHAIAVGKVELVETEAVDARELGEPRVLELRIVISVEIVDADDRATLRQQALRHVETDEAGGAGDQDRCVAHSRHSSTSCGQAARSSLALTSSTTPPSLFMSLRMSCQPPSR